MLQAGEEIDIWVVEKSLGSGGMGSVYRCHNRNAKRILAAVKVLEGAVRSSSDAQARFIREAEILFQLDHPNIVKVRNVRTDNDPPYLEMEFVEGRALEDDLQKGAMPLAQCIDLVEQAAGALAYLHAKGIRHRDIKPANLLVDNKGTLKLVDFGLAMETDHTRITQAGMAFGTVSYAPPEWISPDTLDPEQWDLYSLGVVFYELLTGSMAFPASGQGSARQQAMQVIVGKQNHPPLDPGEDFPQGVRELTRHLTHSDPTKRMGSARELLERCRALSEDGRHAGVTLAPTDIDLDALVPVEPAARKPISPTPTWDDSRDTPVPAPSRRGLSLVALIAVAGLLFVGMGIAGGLVALFFLPDPPEVPVATRPVEVLVLGVPEDIPVRVRLGETTGMASGASTYFNAIEPGTVQLNWVIGEDCPLMECPGVDCPAWCPAGTEEQVVSPGEDSAILRLNITPPSARAVQLKTSLTELQVATLGAATGTISEGALHFEVPPGRYELVASAGRCEAAHIGCFERKDCPDGCISTQRMLEVAVSDDPLQAELGINAPTAPVANPTPRPAPAQPTPHPAPTGKGGTTSLVTSKKFGRFLSDNPMYLPGGKRAAREAVYLAGWDGSTPPAGLGNKPVTNISGLAAASYCRWAGRALPKVTDPPTAPGTQLEYRVTETGNFVVLLEDGSPIPENDPKKANSFATFRCTK